MNHPIKIINLAKTFLLLFAIGSLSYGVNKKSPRFNSFRLISVEAGSTTDIDDLKVLDLDTDEVVYQNRFSTPEDAKRDLKLTFYPQGAIDQSDFTVDDEKNRIVNGKLRLETTGFREDGRGGYSSRSDADYSGILPKNFLVEFEAKRLQNSGHFGFTVFHRSPVDSLGSNEVYLSIFASGSFFHEMGLRVPGMGMPVKFPAPKINLQNGHRLGISLNGSTVGFHIDGKLVESGDVSDYIEESSDDLASPFFHSISGHIELNESLEGKIHLSAKSIPALGAPVGDLYVATSSNKATGDGSLENPFTTLQSAIDLASNGQTIVVSPGTYEGPGNRELDFKGKEIRLLSSHGPIETIVDCGGKGIARLIEGEGVDTLIKGFTFQNSYKKESADWGRAILFEMKDSSPTIEDCIFTNNAADGTFRSGTTSTHLFRSSGGEPVFRNCLIYGNRLKSGDNAAASSIFAGSYKRIENCTITENTVDAMMTDWWYFIRKSIIGVFQIQENTLVTGCIVWNNKVSEIGSRSERDPRKNEIPVPIYEYSITEEKVSGLGNLNQDPLLGSKETGFCLKDGSPGIDAASVESKSDPDGTRADMGWLPTRFLSNATVSYYVSKDEPGPYRMENLISGLEFSLSAFLDENGNGVHDESEPMVEHASNPVLIDRDLTEVNFFLGREEQERSPNRLELNVLGRRDSSDFGVGSNFLSGMALDGNRLASWQEVGNGRVHLWEIADGGEVRLEKRIDSPHRAHDRPTFGCSLVLRDSLLGVGSYYTWRHSPHDGRFYMYDWTKNQRVQDFNPEPQSAQYFGMHSAMSGDMIAVTQGGATHANWRVPGATTFYSINGFEAKQVHRFKQPGNASHTTAVYAHGDYFASSFYSPLSSPKTHTLYLWKVQRDAQGRSIDVRLTDSVEVNDWIPSAHSGTSMVIHGNNLFVGNPNRILDNLSSGFVSHFKISESGKLKLLPPILPSDPQSGMSFGSALACHGEHLIVGASTSANGTSGSGKAYVFEINSKDTVLERQNFYPTNLGEGEKFADMFAISKGLLAIRAGSSALYFYKLNERETIREPQGFDPSEGLIAYYPLDGDALDMSGNGNDGVVYGATLGEDRNGEMGKARPPVGPPTGGPEPLVDYVKLLREIIEEITTVEMELKELVKAGGEKDTEIEKLESELVSITARMSEARSQLKECHEDCNRTREEMAQVKKETLVQNLEITRLEGELRSSATRLGSLRKDRQELTQRIKEIEEQMEEAESKMTSAHTPGWHYTPEQGWLWTSAEHYPLIYSNDREGWVYYERGTSEPWLYFDYNSQKWEHWFFSAPLFSSNN